MSNLSASKFEHPLFEPFAVKILTRAINELSETIHRWVWSGCTGGYVLGPARIGKTTALELIEANINFRDGRNIPAHRVSIPKRDKGTINSIERNLCISAKLHVTNASKSDVLVSNFVSYLLDLVSSYETNRIVLLVDEMQRLSLNQFEAFAEIYDTMREFEIALTTVFIGNIDEVKDKLELLTDKKHKHIFGRFFTQSHLFKGLQSESEVAECLKEYDTRRYPEIGGPTYTEYFVPKAFRAGWRFEVLSGLLWQQFREYQKAYSIDSWGMQYFREIVDMLLIDYLSITGVDEINSEMIRSCFEASSLVPNLVSDVST